MTVILIVEDDVLANEYLEFILQQAGYEVISATSADEAAGLLEDREDVQLIVTDINLPGSINGLKLATAAKAKRPKVNIIIVSDERERTSEQRFPHGTLPLSVVVKLSAPGDQGCDQRHRASSGVEGIKSLRYCDCSQK